MKEFFKAKKFPFGAEVFEDCVKMGFAVGMVLPSGRFFQRESGSWGYGSTVCGDQNGLLLQKTVKGNELWTLSCESLSRSKKILLQYKDKIYYADDSVMKSIYVFFTGNAKHPPLEKIADGYLGSWLYWFNEGTGKIMPKGKHFADFVEGKLIIPVTEDFYYGRPAAYEIAVLRDGKVFSLGYLDKKDFVFPAKFRKNPEKYVMRPCHMLAMEVLQGKHEVRHVKVLDFMDEKQDLSICGFDQLFDY